MEKRLFGRSSHMSSVAIFGGAAFWDVSQKEADRTFETVLSAGVNHIDIAPSYGKGEKLTGPWMKRVREHFFLGCKTMERSKKNAWDEMHQSFKRLHVERFDLYQCHAVTNIEELDACTVKGGALEAILEAKEAGLTSFIGITSHGLQAPTVLLEALRRFDFDSVLFPLNYILFSDEAYRSQALKLIDVCGQRQVGMMTIKSIARGRWGNQKQSHTTWYQPFIDPTEIQEAVNFVLSQAITGICMAGDTRLLPIILQACERYHPLNVDEQADLYKKAKSVASEEALFPN